MCCENYSSVINLDLFWKQIFSYRLHAFYNYVFFKVLAYFATTVSYSHKMFMKLTPGGADAPMAMAVCGGMATIF